MIQKVQRAKSAPKTHVIRNLLIIVLLLTPALILPGKTSAQTIDPSGDVLKLLRVQQPEKHPPKKPIKKKVIPPAPQPTSYVVQPNENLDNIAIKFNTTWQRIWAKNPALTDPNIINVGYTLIIPFPDESLADRPLPTMVVQHPIISLLNSYEPGQCTWYVKNQRPDIPNTWGNAYSWLYNAQAEGWPTGSVPKVGAVAVRGNHVMYIEAVDGDWVTYSDMNGNWIPFELGHHTVLASTLEYIY